MKNVNLEEFVPEQAANRRKMGRLMQCLSRNYPDAYIKVDEKGVVTLQAIDNSYISMFKLEIVNTYFPKDIEPIQLVVDMDELSKFLQKKEVEDTPFHKPTPKMDEVIMGEVINMIDKTMENTEFTHGFAIPTSVLYRLLKSLTTMDSEVYKIRLTQEKDRVSIFTYYSYEIQDSYKTLGVVNNHVELNVQPLRVTENTPQIKSHYELTRMLNIIAPYLTLTTTHIEFAKDKPLKLTLVDREHYMQLEFLLAPRIESEEEFERGY